MTSTENKTIRQPNEKYVEMDEFHIAIRQKLAVPLNETAKRLGSRLMSMKPSSIRILGTLFVAERMTVKELSEAANVSFANMAKHIDELVFEGFVTRHENPENRRYIMVEITESGKALNEENERLIGEINECYFNKFLSNEEIDSFRYHLSELTRMAQKFDPAYIEKFSTVDAIREELCRQRGSHNEC